MRHRHGADDGPTPSLWDDAAARAAGPARAPPARKHRPGRRADRRDDGGAPNQ